MENKKMLAKLKTGKFYDRSRIYSKENENRINVLNKYAGAWVEIETEHLFNDQYNITLDGVGIRIFDADITEIQNDARAGACKCGYCGKTFSTLDDYKKHIDENKRLFETKEHCAKCFWNQSKIIDTQREKTREIAENGDEITKETTTYTWHKECVHGENYGAPCSLLECANEKYLHVFTPKNTYFLKYPKGYDGYFRSLSFDDKMREKGYMYIGRDGKQGDGLKMYKKNSFAGTYDLTVYVSDETIKYCILANTKRAFYVSGENIDALLNDKTGYCYARGAFSALKLFENFPKTYENALYKAFDAIRDAYKHTDYIHEFIKF